MGESKRRKQQDPNYGKVKNPVKNLMKVFCPFFEDYNHLSDLNSAKNPFKIIPLKPVSLYPALAIINDILSELRSDK
ncbi:MAG: hypothetical protein ACKPGB_16840 [Dolichospermum sp.]